MKTPNEILRLQISFCETYLANHPVESENETNSGVSAYVSAQLALALGLLSVNGQVQAVTRAAQAVRMLGKVPSFPAHLAA